MPKIKKPIQLVIFIGFCLSAGAVGSLFTVSSIPTWYATLIKPSFSPPNWIFAPVWTILYILMGISAYIIWTKKKTSLKIFWIQLVVNFLWSYLFFGLKNPLLGFIWIILLWILIVLMIKSFLKINKLAGLLLAPYLAWVTLASYLNLSIWLLN